MLFIQENLAFNLSITESIPASNKQMMKAKLHTVKPVLSRHPWGML